MNEVTVRRIPERLMPDERNQFVQTNIQGEEWADYDSWGIEQACKLITLGYPVWLEGMAEEVKGWPLDCEGRDRFNTMTLVYYRALRIAKSTVHAGMIKEHDTPANWIKWAKNKGYSVAHLMPADAHAAKVEALPVEQADTDHDKILAALFDPLPVEALEKMFPAGGKWVAWADKAASNGLQDARVARAKFNPYKAGLWFVRKGAKDWDDARLYRTLTNNLPARSRDKEHLLTGGID